MNLAAPPTVDLLASALDRVRALLMDDSRTTKDRAHLLWAAAKKARDFASRDVVSDEFMRLAIETLIDQRGRWTGGDVRESVRPFGAEDVAHLISWAMRGWNPFDVGELK